MSTDNSLQVELEFWQLIAHLENEQLATYLESIRSRNARQMPNPLPNKRQELVKLFEEWAKGYPDV